MVAFLVWFRMFDIEDDNNKIIKIYVYSLENKRRYNKITSMKYALNQEIGESNNLKAVVSVKSIGPKPVEQYSLR